ncbi:hypothetical protein [Benzoatithermus flavus]|uniref:Uncharacterized protein n=1 Tax=Benzoatithermus flavus TaxID=3108223 RepID=A0ABU8XNY2_9PROT
MTLLAPFHGTVPPASELPAGTAAMPDDLRLRPATVFAWHLAIIALLALAGTIVVVAALSFHREYLFGLRHLFDLDRENNVPTMASTMGLLAAAALLAVVARDERRRASPLRHHWTALAMGFVLLALDEGASLHELFNGPVRGVLHEPGFAAAWVLVGGGGAILVGLAFLPFLLRIRPETARLFILAGVIFLGGAIGLEAIGSEILEHWPRMSYPFQIEAIIEETLEMVGIACFVLALLRELQWRGISLTIRFG